MSDRGMIRDKLSKMLKVNIEETEMMDLANKGRVLTISRDKVI
jgi:hypothetical protein